MQNEKGIFWHFIKETETVSLSHLQKYKCPDYLLQTCNSSTIDFCGLPKFLHILVLLEAIVVNFDITPEFSTLKNFLNEPDFSSDCQRLKANVGGEHGIWTWLPNFPFSYILAIFISV